MDFYKAFEELRKLLKDFIPQLNRLCLFLLASWIVANDLVRTGIRNAISSAAHSKTIPEIKALAGSFGLMPVLPIAILLLCLALIYYFDITTIELGRHLPPNILVDEEPTLRKHYSRDVIITVWSTNTRLRSMHELSKYLDMTYSENFKNDAYRNAWNSKMAQESSRQWMTYYKVLFYWILLVPFLSNFFSYQFHGASGYVRSNLSPNHLGGPNQIVVLVFIFLSWLYYARAFVNSIARYSVWKLYGFLDIKGLDYVREEAQKLGDGLPPFLQVSNWDEMQRLSEFLVTRAKPAWQIEIIPAKAINDLLVLSLGIFLSLLPRALAFRLARRVKSIVPFSRPRYSNNFLTLFSDKLSRRIDESFAQEISPELIKPYASFLARAPRYTQIIRLAPAGRYDGLISIPEGSSCYSFSSQSYNCSLAEASNLKVFKEISLGIAGMEIRVHKLGVIINLGFHDFPQEDTIGKSFFSRFSEMDMQQVSRLFRYSTPFSLDQYHNLQVDKHLSTFATAKVRLGHLYLFRAWDYSFHYSLGESIFVPNDSIAMFRVLAQLDDGSIVMIYRLLHGCNTPIYKADTVRFAFT